ncbi:MAG: TetR-like C-terminal domain-containing protein [Micropruina sp.]
MSATGAAIAERARHRGEWSDDTDPNLVFFTIVGAIYHRRLFARAPADDTWLQALVALIPQGIAPRADNPG